MVFIQRLFKSKRNVTTEGFLMFVYEFLMGDLLLRCTHLTELWPYNHEMFVNLQVL